MRRRAFAFAVLFAACGAVAIARRTCGTDVQVVGMDGMPVAGAVLRLRPSPGANPTTDAQGRARLPDSWFHRPFAATPGWLIVSMDGQHWWFTYPPSAVVVLAADQAWPRTPKADLDEIAAPHGASRHR